MIVTQDVGITSYGVYLPDLVMKAEEISRAQGDDGQTAQCLGIEQKTVPDHDEDTATLAIEATYQAVERVGGDVSRLGGVFIGSESHPYAVKPTGTILKAALNLPEQLSMADLQFACKAGTQSFQIGVAYVLAGMAEEILAVGSDTAQSRAGDVLEFTAAAGAAAYIIGRSNILVRVLATTSMATDTPDFWRRHGQDYPQHAGRFSGEPGYFYHVQTATQHLLEECQLTPDQIDHCVFHTPNAKFPTRVAKKMGFCYDQLKTGLLVGQIGNTYAAASLIGLAAVLDKAQPGQKILVTSYGSGAGADSFLLETTKLLPSYQQASQMFVRDYLKKAQPVSYGDYINHTQGH